VIERRTAERYGVNVEMNTEIGPWKAYRGVGCALILVLLAVCENEALRFGYRNSPTFTNWIRNHWHFVEGSLRLLRGCEWILAAGSILCAIREYTQNTWNCVV